MRRLLLVIGAAIVVVAGTFPMGAAAGSLPRSLDRTPSGDRVSGLTLSQAPSGLRAAVGRTLGVRDTAVSSPFQQAKLTVACGCTNGFGGSVAIYGATAVVGSPSSGAAYVFVRSGTKWSQQAELTNRHVSGAANFGDSVAIYGQTAVIGAQGKNSYTGAAYVYVRSGSKWSRQAKLTASDAAVGDQFGTAVAINGSTAVIGARDASSTGAAYVFVRSRSRWSQQAKLTASDAAADDEFGYSVGIYGATAVVGAPFKESGGAAYVFAGL